MTEGLWLADDNVISMLLYCQGKADLAWRVGPRQQLLLAAAACRAYWNVVGPRWQECVSEWERRADGRDAPLATGCLDLLVWLIDEAGTPSEQQRRSRRTRLAVLCREIVGNPFRPLLLRGDLPPRGCPSCHTHMALEANHQHGLGLWHCPASKEHPTQQVTLEEMRIHKAGGSPWRTPTVLDLARKAYASVIHDGGPRHGQMDPEQLLVLSDALEDAGCDDEPILMHLRGRERLSWPSACDDPYGTLRGPHVRGCHLIDLLLRPGNAMPLRRHTSGAGAPVAWH